MNLHTSIFGGEGQVDRVLTLVRHEVDQQDEIEIVHDRDLGEVRIVVNDECVWSTLERS